jgi:hypothetical protein
MNYNNLYIRQGLILALVLLIYQNCSPPNTGKTDSLIEVNIKKEKILNDTFYISFILDAKDLYNGSSTLVIDTLIFTKGSANFNYNYKKFKNGIFRLNFYPYAKKIIFPQEV